MKESKIIYTVVLFVSILLGGCVNDLDVSPIDPDVNTPNNVFDSEEAYKEALAKLYASYALSGQLGNGGGDPDISGIDEGFGNYIRQYWSLQQLSTDEAIMAWDDATIKNFHWQTWAPNDTFIAAMYSRIFYTVTISNEFIRNVDAAIGDASGTFKTDLEAYKEEARFIRAFSYWHAIDMFGNVPFVTEEDLPGAFFPERILRADLFDYIETELLDIESKITAVGNNEYARADQGAVWMLLAKLYLNAEVYTGTERNSDALTYVEKIIGGGYSLEPVYENLFRADNNLSNEIIFPIAFDGQNTQQYGGMTFLLHASVGGDMPLNGIDGGWGGIRAIQDMVEKFGVSESDFSTADPEFTAITDKRGMFYYDPASWEWDITNVGTFTQGIGVTKFKNISSDGGEAPNAHPTFVSTDLPVFRLGDAYLMYAEIVVRGGGGDMGTAVGYVNELRTRAGVGSITAADMDLDFLLDERSRELYWEGHRRTDLIRFGEFTDGTEHWEWKGNVQSGVATDAYRDLFPIPSNDLNANPNLEQNDGYPQ
ncbi:SusD family protein [Reichenbachiella agariperforans]|uniref:SusD family protein n=1 Tax=Reichenbachiella agariperforans TaxID=156994 RepID=A0A1M6KZV5_REIAG|nr:RagB/SusD family nutrient uptake outer membrane protein [Reichenbachiella agariperforans]SHJ64518.1 SusD family protein [Reichenbachiella agariperforans]